MTKDISSYDDIIDIRDVIELVESGESGDYPELEYLLEELAGQGGDEEYKGDWYPGTLIRESYMQDYAQEYAEDCGLINRDATWPNNCIDWEQATEEFLIDYSSVEFQGVTYYYR